MNVEHIVKQAGGRERIAERIGKTPGAVKKWPKLGIPDRYWPAIIALSGGSVSLSDLYQANLTARSAGEAERV